jgi:hypothetical protein
MGSHPILLQPVALNGSHAIPAMTAYEEVDATRRKGSTPWSRHGSAMLSYFFTSGDAGIVF